MAEPGEGLDSIGSPSSDLAGKRILIIKPSSLGDIIHTLPVVHALKRCHPTCRIGWIAEQGYAPLLARDPAVERVHAIHIPSTSNPDSGKAAYVQALSATLRTLRQLRAVFRQESYDLILDFHASFRSALLALTNPGGLRLGFADARELNPVFQHQRVPNPGGITHAVEKNLLFCRWLGCAPRPEDFHLRVGTEDCSAVERFLVKQGIDAGTPLVYVNPTARWQSKFWLASRWAELADRLLLAGVLPVFGGGPGDVGTIMEITGQMRGRAIIAAGQLNLTESVALMHRAAVYAGLDTGPMHMAAMADVPVVALFGPTHPERVGPYGRGHIVLQAAGLDCLCCRRRSCAHQRCMHGITVDMVQTAVMTLVGKRGGLWTSA